MNKRTLNLAMNLTRLNTGLDSNEIVAFKNKDKTVTYLIKNQISGESFNKLKAKKANDIIDFKNGSKQFINLK